MYDVRVCECVSVYGAVTAAADVADVVNRCMDDITN